MAVELATAYISLVPSTSKLAPAVSDALGDTDKPAKQAGLNIGGKLVDGVGKVLKTGALAVGGIAVAGIGTALVKGFSRLSSLDQATAKLSGLGMSAETVQKIMDNALASVKGTAFGMDEAATTSAMAVAAGIKPGQQLEGVLKTVADTATIAGASMSDMGMIFGSVAARGKLQGDDLMQLQSRGVPVLQFLAKHYGITAQAASTMVSKGEVDFKNFEAAMQENLGGAALKSGETFTGAWDNMLAALGRFGAKALGGIFPALKGGIGAITEWVDSLAESMGPFFENIGNGLGDFISGITMSAGDRAEFAGQLQGMVAVGANLRSALEGVVAGVGQFVGFVKSNWDVISSAGVALGVLATGLTIANAAATVGAAGGLKAWFMATKTGTAIQAAFNLVLNANPIMLIVTAVAALVAGLVYFFTQTKVGQQIWAGFTKALGTAWNWLWNTILSPVIDAIGAAFNWLWTSVIKPVADFIGNVIRVVAAVITWWWQNVTMPAINGIVAVFQFMWGIVKPIFDLWIGVFKLVGAIAVWLWNNAVVPMAQGIAQIVSWLWTNAIQPVFGWIGDKMKLVGLGFKILYQSYVKPAFDLIASAFQWIWSSVVKPIFDKIGAAVKIVGDAIGTAFRVAGDTIRAAFKSVVGFVKNVFNGMIDAVNGVINGINGVAGVVGDALGVDLRISTIPRLAQGAVIKSGSGGVVAQVGEGRYDEAVIPLGGAQFQRLAAALTEGSSGRGTQVNVEVNPAPGMDERTLGITAAREIDWQLRGA
ncbi:tape measure protein [Microbacterium sp. KR10-403]|uniref:tape measure protein n=1 Tax=Microbacterium sp. KR10-403 TaxID=3158581 RepID=UPI0032E4D24F